MISAQLRRSVYARAAGRCEYCRSTVDPLHAPLQIDHIIAVKHRGTDDESNLALSCFFCNSSKGPNLTGLDPPGTGSIVRLFNPRIEKWDEHFERVGYMIVGRTPTGRVTVYVMGMNDAEALPVRIALVDEGAW